MRNLEDPLGVCPQGYWSPVELRLITCEQLALDSLRLAELVPQDASAVIGIPRSGMIPASVIASHLAVPLYAAVGGEEEVVELSGGRRTRGLSPGQGPLLLVDDSVGSGWQLSQFELLRRECEVAAVYVLPASVGLVDYHVHLVDDPHLFEWNVWNGPGATLAALDMDGVVCADTPPDVNGAAWEYADAEIATLSPLYVPRNPQFPVAAIITARTERTREATAKWLANQRAQYRDLIMWSGDAADRTPEAVAAWKADHVKRIKATFYVESDPLLSEIMRRDHQVPVLCMRDGVLR